MNADYEELRQVAQSVLQILIVILASLAFVELSIIAVVSVDVSCSCSVIDTDATGAQLRVAEIHDYPIQPLPFGEGALRQAQGERSRESGLFLIFAVPLTLSLSKGP